MKCSKCNQNGIYVNDSDNYVCLQCNAWIESPCGDPECLFCINLPEDPREYYLSITMKSNNREIEFATHDTICIET